MKSKSNLVPYLHTQKQYLVRSPYQSYVIVSIVDIVRSFSTLTKHDQCFGVFISLVQEQLKMTQINQVSRNQLHNAANSCQHFNFGLSWPDQGTSVKAKRCYSSKFSLLCTETALSQSSIIAQYPKQNMIEFSQQPC